MIEELRTLFARFGIPESIVTDNGTCFVSEEFESFLKTNGIRLTTSAPYHPSLNGLAERAVQIVKRGLRKIKSGSMNTRLAKVLFSYRITPQPQVLHLQSCCLGGVLERGWTCCALTQLIGWRKSSDNRRESMTQRLKPVPLRRGKQYWSRTLDVVADGYLGSECSSPGSFKVCLEDGRMRRCHQDHLRKRLVEDESEMSQLTPQVPTTDSGTSVEITPSTVSPQVPPEPEPPSEPSASPETVSNERPSEPRYPCRRRKTRQHFEPGT